MSTPTYSVAEVVGYSLALGAGVLALRRVVDELEVRVSHRFLVATLPMVLWGALAKTMSDTGRFPESMSAPVVFVAAGAGALLLLAAGAAVERRTGVRYEWVSSGAGSLLLAYPAAQVLMGAAHVEAGLRVLAVFALSTALVLALLSAWGYTYPWGLAAVAGHMLDASSTVVGVERGYLEELPLEGMVMSLAGTPYAIFPMKLLALGVAFWVVDRASAWEDRRFWYFVFFVLGFAPGVRNTATLMMLG